MSKIAFRLLRFTHYGLQIMTDILNQPAVLVLNRH